LRGKLGLLLLGGAVAIIGTMMGLQGRKQKPWTNMIMQRLNWFKNMNLMNRISGTGWVRRGRRLIRNLNWS
jgi:hypothetical protein